MSSSSQQPSPPAKASKVLVVEDQDILRMMLAGYLMQIGYAVEIAADGLEGWHKFSNGEFDLVITDINMPNLDGIELIRLLRGSNRPVRIIVHSSSLTEAHLRELELLGVDATLAKGSLARQLRDTVAQVIHSSA
jgi:CheY-like chemotaxis protein